MEGLVAMMSSYSLKLSKLDPGQVRTHMIVMSPGEAMKIVAQMESGEERTEKAGSLCEGASAEELEAQIKLLKEMRARVPLEIDETLRNRERALNDLKHEVSKRDQIIRERGIRG